MEEKNEERRGIFVEKDYTEIAQLTEKEKIKNIRNKIILRIIGIIIAIFLIKNLITNLGYIMTGAKSFWSIVGDFSSIILFICIVVYIIVSIRDESWEKRKIKNIQAYMKIIRVYDKENLFQELNSLGLKAIKKVYYDDSGNIGIQGRISKHCFVLTEVPTVSFVSSNHDYKGAAEGETIVANLIKKLDPNVPINAFEKEKNNERLISLKRRLAILAIITGILFLFIILTPGVTEGGNAYIEMVQSSSPDAYPDVTYGEAFNNYFSNPEWEYFVSDDDSQVVEFNGRCLYLNEEADVTVQFLLTDLENENNEYLIEFGYLGINGQSQSDIVKWALVEEIFGDYYNTYSSDGDNL